MKMAIFILEGLLVIADKVMEEWCGQIELIRPYHFNTTLVTGRKESLMDMVYM